MNFARHLLRRATAAPVKPIIQLIILPAAAPLHVTSIPIPRIPQIISHLQLQKRHESTVIGSFPDHPSIPESADKKVEEVKPSYDLTFTCKPCGHRSTHNISKQGYHYGSVLITCPGCHNRHVISDHLKIFSETSRSFEEILNQAGHGQKLRYSAGKGSHEEQLAAEDILRSRGIWSENGDVEVLPGDNEGGPKPTEESWTKGLDAGGRNVYPDPDEEPEERSTVKAGDAKEVGDGATEGANSKERL